MTSYRSKPTAIFSVWEEWNKFGWKEMFKFKKKFTFTFPKSKKKKYSKQILFSAQIVNTYKLTQINYSSLLHWNFCCGLKFQILFFIFISSDDLLADPSSFIYGQSPGTGNVPIYAMVTICNSLPLDNELEGQYNKHCNYKHWPIWWICVFLLPDIQSNLVDSKVGRHQATYIPVSKTLLKNSRRKTPSALPRPVSISKRIVPDHITAPDDTNTTVIVNATNLRYTRDLVEVSTVADDVAKTTESTPIPSSTIPNESNEIGDNNETHELNNDATAKPNSASKESPSSNSSYPTFHVTYWMFYPYSQVMKNLLTYFGQRKTEN